MIDVLSEYIFIVSVEGKLVECNQRGIERLGYAKEEVEGIEASNIICDGIEHIENSIREKKKGTNITVTMRTKSGGYVEGKAVLGYTNWRNMDCGYVVLSEMQVQDKPDNHLNNKETCKIIYKNPGLMSVGYETEKDEPAFIRDSKILENMMYKIVSLVNAKAIGIYLYSERNKTLDLQLAIGFYPEDISLIKYIDVNEEVTGRCFKEREVIRRCPLYNPEDTPIGAMMRKKNIYYVERYPITFDNEVLGVMNIAYEDNDKEKESYKESSRYLIHLAADQVGIVVKNTMLYKQVNQELERRRVVEEDRRLFFDTTTELIGVIGYDGIVKEMGNECTKILGWSKEEIQLNSVMHLIHREDQANVCRSIEIAKKNEKVMECTVRCLTKCNEYRWISWKYRYIRERNVFICSGRDVTEDKKREEENQRLEEIVALEEVKSEFFTNMSHEFKTPLNIILSTLQLIDQDIEEFKSVRDHTHLMRYMQFIRQNSYRLLKLVNNIIDMTKMDTGYYSLKLENHNVINVIEEITLSVAQYVESKGIKLIFDTDSEEKIMACDAEQIERIMLNLLSNAIKYTNEQGEIRVNVSNKDTYIEVSVKDSGVGMQEDELKNIFKRFVRANTPFSKRKEGSGIGLALVKTIIEMHEGDIRVKSKLNKGTEFIFRLPVKHLEKSETERKVESYPVEENRHQQKCSIEFCSIDI